MYYSITNICLEMHVRELLFPHTSPVTVLYTGLYITLENVRVLPVNMHLT